MSVKETILPIKFKRIEWSELASFLSVCQTNNLSHSANFMQISRSTMSERLSKLEEILDIPIFKREHKKIYVDEIGLYLARYIMPMMAIEHFSRQLYKTMMNDIYWVNIKFPLHFYGHRICRVLEKSISLCQETYPNILFWPQSSDSFDIRPIQDLQWQPSWKKLGTIELDWVANSEDDGTYFEGKWYLLSRYSYSLEKNVTIDELRTQKVLLPRIPWKLLQHISSLIEKYKLNIEYVNIDYKKLFFVEDDKSYYLVNSLLINEFELSDEWQISYIEDLPSSYLGIKKDVEHPIMYNFIKVYQKLFYEIEEFYWETGSQLKHWQYFYKTIKAGSVSLSAKQLYMSQSALSIQLKQLENCLNIKLLQRGIGKNKQTLTKQGEIFLELCDAIGEVLDYLSEQSERYKHLYNKKIVLGILPSIDTKSTLLKMIVEQVDIWQQEHSDVKIEIVEERHHYLIDGLRNNEINIAIVEADSRWVIHYPLQKEEEMGLVINPSLIGINIKELNWLDLVNFNLVLPRKGNGMRMIIDQHCLGLGIKLDYAIESDSLNLNQFWVQKGKYATILPRSAVASLVDAKILKFVQLKPTLNRILRLAHLKNKSLSSIENNLLHFLLNSM